jgi:hypothetical protein
MPFLFAGLLNHNDGAWNFLVGNQIGAGQMHWQRVAGQLFN